MDNGYREAVIDAKGRHRGMKQWTVCPHCENGRWVRGDSLIRDEYTGLCQKCHNKYTGVAPEKHGSWHGGYTVKDGRKYIRVPATDPLYSMAKNGYIREHRLVMARHLGRIIEPWEIVHHKDGDIKNNKIENLMILGSRVEHQVSSLVMATVTHLKKKVTLLIEQLEYCQELLAENGISYHLPKRIRPIKKEVAK